MVKSFLETIKTSEKGLFDESLKDYWVNDSTDMDDVNDISEDEAAYTELYTSYIKDFDYKILESTVENDTAMVSVEFTTYPIAEMFMALMMKVFTNLFDPANVNLSEEEINQKYVDWFEEIAQDYSKNRVSTVDINLVKIEGEWKFSADDSNIDFIDALLGGLLSGFESEFGTESYIL